MPGSERWGTWASNPQALRGGQSPPEDKADLDPIPELFLQVTHLLNQYSSRAHTIWQVSGQN